MARMLAAVARGTTERMRRGAKATGQGCRWPVQGTAGAQDVAGGHTVHADARVGHHVARGVGR